MRYGSQAAIRLLLIATVSFAGCGRKGEEPTAPIPLVSPVQDKTTSPEQSRYLQAAEPFVQAIAHQRYQEAYGLLSRQARSRMTLNQFVAPADTVAFQRNEQPPFTHGTPADFAELMGKVEDLYGLPQVVESISVFSTDPDVLGHRSREESGIMESASAVGAMPDSIPSDVRRASVHVQIATQLTPDQLAQIAMAMNMSPEELQGDPNFKPSFNVKLVLVEEDGQLKVGYFEFLPASRWT
jgi:predicted small lipoprotein YifL